MGLQSEKSWTVQRIADHLSVARHRVEYVIKARGIAPVDRAGIARLFSSEAVQQIEWELQQIQQLREGASNESL